MSRFRSSILAVALTLASVDASTARADVTPPHLVQGPEAVYPEAARAARRGDVVVPLRIVIEDDGTVSEATVIEPQGDGLDEAAVAAVRGYVFDPAMRDGVPMRVAVRFDFLLRMPVEEEPEVDPEPEPEPLPPPGRLTGRLLRADDGSPMPDVDVVLVDAAGAEQTTRTDSTGAFAFDALPPGEYRVVLRPLGMPERAEAEQIASNEETAVVYRFEMPEESDFDEGIVATAVVDPPPREVSRRTLTAEVLNSIPGTRGDPLRAIEILPGVARPPFGLGLIIVRGAAPGDTQVLLDGVPIPLLYHFGGLTSVFNGRLLSRVDFYPGNFSSRYGRKMGGILEVDTRDPRTDRVHGNIETSIIDASIMIEGPVTRRFAIAGSARRSLIDTWFGAVAPQGLGVTAAPAYYDYQLLGTYTPNSRDRVRFRIYGSDDRFKLFIGNDLADDPAVRGRAGLATRFNFFQTNWRRNLSARTTQDVVFQTGPTVLQFGLGRLARFVLDSWNFYGRGEWATNLNEHVRIVGGADISAATVNISYLGNAIGQSEGNTQNQTQSIVRFDDKIFNIRPGAYVDLALTYGHWLVNIAGRADYYSEINRGTFDPRVVANYRVNEQWRVRAGAGLFTQPPEFQESARTIGNPNLRPVHSAHFGVGMDWTPREGMSLTVDGFAKPIWNRVISTVDGSTPFFRNAGIGRIYGMEVQGRINLTETRPYFFNLAYTLMRSERRDPSGAWRPFDFDQTHILSSSFLYQFRRHHWELGSTVRAVSGNPYTPATGSVFDPISGSNYPINGITNSARVPMYFRFDVRVEKQWWFDSWKLALFLDVQNATNRQNPETVLYNYDYSRVGYIHGLPIIPALGLRGEF